MRTPLKKSRRMMSIENVESNDELLSAILVRLPPPSIFRFKCVSKRWKGIFCDPYFHESYRVRTRNEQLCDGGGRLVAFVQVKKLPVYRCYLGQGPYDFMKVLQVAPLGGYKIKQLPCEFGTVEHCTTDGLVLCTANYVNYFVVNPLNRTWDMLPESYLDEHHNLGLVCEENRDILVPSYRVIGLSKMSTRYHGLEPNTVFIETYSFRTGKWKLSKLVCAEEIHQENMYEYPFVYNGVFHWHLSKNRALAVYDSNFEDEKFLQLINLPLDDCSCCALTRTSVDDVLWVGLVRYRESITFWMLPRDENGNYKRITTITKGEWVLKHTIAIGFLTRDVLMVLESKKRKKTGVCEDMVAKELKFIFLVGLIPSNPLLAVFNMRPQKIFLYNLETKSIEFITYRGHPFGRKKHTEWNLFREPLYLSAYAPLARAYD